MCSERYPDTEATTSRPAVTQADGVVDDLAARRRRLAQQRQADDAAEAARRRALNATIAAGEQELADNALTLDERDDPSLLRALATDVEEPDSGYAFGAATAERLRSVATAIEDKYVTRGGVADAMRQLSTAIEDGADHIVVVPVYENPKPGELSARDLPALLDLIRALEGSGDESPTDDVE